MSTGRGFTLLLIVLASASIVFIAFWDEHSRGILIPSSIKILPSTTIFHAETRGPAGLRPTLLEPLGLLHAVNFTLTADSVPIFKFYNACVTDRSITFISGTVAGAEMLSREWRNCCESVAACPIELRRHRGHLCGQFGLYSSPKFVLNISGPTEHPVEFIPGPSLLMDIAITNFYQYGHAVSRFIQSAVLEVPLSRVVVNKHHRPPGEFDRQDERNIAFVYNITVRAMEVPVLFTAGRFVCFNELNYIPNYERPFYSTRQASTWRANAGAKLGIQWSSCPPGRAVLLRRFDEKPNGRRFVNPEVIDEVAASFGIPRVHRVTIGSVNSTAETARLFASFGLMVTVHSSQLKGLMFASPNSAVIEMGGSHLGMWRVSPFSEGMAELGVHYNLSRFHFANVTACGTPCASEDKNAPITINKSKFSGALAAVLKAQRDKCSQLRYSL